MTFEEALNHLRSGNIITNDNKDFHYIENGKIKTFYFYNGHQMIINSDLESAGVLKDDWTCLNEDEVEKLGIRRK